MVATWTLIHTNQQQVIDNIARKLEIKSNETKTAVIDSTYQRSDHQAGTLNDIKIPSVDTVKYLRMNLDAKFHRNVYSKKKQKELQIEFRKFT